mgnify:FL=1
MLKIRVLTTTTIANPKEINIDPDNEEMSEVFQIDNCSPLVEKSFRSWIEENPAKKPPIIRMKIVNAKILESFAKDFLKN